MRSYRAALFNSPQRRGALLIWAALCLIIVMGFLAFTVDFGYIVVTDQELQNAADAGALSGARALPNGRAAAADAAIEWSAKNTAANESVSTMVDEDVEMGLWDDAKSTFTALPDNSPQSPNAVRVTCRMSAARGNALKLFFAPVLGIDSANLAASAIAKTSTSDHSFRFLIDDEMFDTDEPAIENLAEKLGTTPDSLLTDGNEDGFIDIPGGKTLELSTGQVGDEALFDTQSYPEAFPFGESTSYTHTDFLAEGTALEAELGTNDLQDVEWTGADAPHFDFIGKKVLDPVPGADPMAKHSQILALPNPDVTHVSPVFKSDVAMQERDPSKYGSPTANLQGERRGLVAFQIISARPNPKGESYLPLLTIRIVDPATIDVKNGVRPSAGTSGSSKPRLVN